MTFLERYRKEDTWHGKAMIMEIYHLAMSHNVKTWTISKTAEQFQCSIGLVSENLKLAHAIHITPAIINQTSRQDALNWLANRRIVDGT
jgi:hypothetical protein